MARKSNIITEENTLLENLTDLVYELENRKQVFREYGYANILTGQIRNNIDFRVCGRADNVNSERANTS